MTAEPSPLIASQRAWIASPGAFDGLRLVAALAVLFTHSYPLFGREQLEPLARLTNGSTTFSELGLLTFFAISGNLVTQSWFRDPSIWRFFMRRSVRIIPGLTFVIFLSFAIVGPFLTTLDVADYFSGGKPGVTSPRSWCFLGNTAYPGYSQIIHFRPSLMDRCGRYESRSSSIARSAFSAWFEW